MSSLEKYVIKAPQDLKLPKIEALAFVEEIL